MHPQSIFSAIIIKTSKFFKKKNQFLLMKKKKSFCILHAWASFRNDEAEWCQTCSLLTFDISELPVFLFLNISKTVADIFLIFYIWIHIDDMH